MRQNSWDARGSLSSGANLYRFGMTTDLSETDVIMGEGEKRLFRAIKQAVADHRPPAVFVYNTCVTALTGDDLGAVCKAAAKRFELPVIPVDCAGFYGGKSLGNRVAGETAFKHIIGTREPDPVPASAERPGRRHAYPWLLNALAIFLIFLILVIFAPDLSRVGRGWTSAPSRISQRSANSCLDRPAARSGSRSVC